MSGTSLIESSEGRAPHDARPEVGVRFVCLTTWPTVARDAVALFNLPDDPREVDQLDQALKRGATMWCEFEFVGAREALRWFEPSLEPWQASRRPLVRWSDVDPVLSLLNVTAPDLGGSSAPSEALNVLPLVYTLGVRRASAELGTSAASVRLFPALGFQEPDGSMDAWMNRISVAAVDHFVFTARLPPRRWPPRASGEAPAPEPTLVVKERFIPAGGQPTPRELAQGIAVYQAATCGAVVTREKTRLRGIEQALLDGTLPPDDPDSREMLDPRGLGENYRQMFGLGERGEHIEHELARLVARFDEPSPTEDSRTVRAMFGEALDNVHSFQTDIRQRTDCIASMVATQQFALAEQQQEATDKFQRRATIVGSAVLVPALVAAVFGANVALPGEEQEGGLVAMLFLMIALGAGTWWGIFSLDHKQARLTARPWATKFAHVHASFVVAATCLVFGIVALTPAADSSLAGDQALGAAAGGLVLAFGLAATVWCRLNVRSPSDWWAHKPRAATATRTAAWIAPLVAAVGAMLSALLFTPNLL